MDLKEIGNELVAGCREGRESENLDKLYAQDAVSVEAMDMGGQGRETKGLDGIKGKHQWWDSTMEMIDGKIDGPYPHGQDRFAVIFGGKAKNKENGEIMEIDEVAVYHVDGGKIVREEFFYTM